MPTPVPSVATYPALPTVAATPVPQPGSVAAGVNPFPAPAPGRPPVAADCKRPGLLARVFGHAADDGSLSMKDVGCLIDDLDKALLKYGVIAVKAADVWGQNRMTKFRAEFEKEMAADTVKFGFVLSAAQSRSDVAALTSATALGVAVAKGQKNQGKVGSPQITVDVPTPGDLTKGMVTSASTLVGSPSAVRTLDAAIKDYTTPAAAGLPPPVGLEPTVYVDEHARFLYQLQQLRRINTGDDTADLPGYGLYLVRMPVSLLPGCKSREGKGALVTVQACHHLTPELLPNAFRDFVINDLAGQLAPILASILHDPDFQTDYQCIVRTGKLCPVVMPAASAGPTGRPQSKAMTAINQARFTVTSGSPAVRGGTKAASSLDVVNLYGEDTMLALAVAVRRAMDSAAPLDFNIEAFLRGELRSAYDYMMANRSHLNFQIQTFELVRQLINTRHFVELQALRTQWIMSLPGYCQVLERQDWEAVKPIEGLSFAIMVQSVLLDQLLKEDIERIAVQKGCVHGNPWEQIFYGFDPSPEARALFNAYVACKWPIHVFAVDPVVDQQNVLDLFSMRRELQLALAIAVSTGQIKFENATQYARRLELDREAIALHATAVGFGAGEATFGWKFYPRVQSPHTESNLQAIANLFVWNGPGPYYDLCHSKIEPGLRECVALVVMPNFVPYVRFDTTTNWFCLNGCLPCPVLSTDEMLEMSQKMLKARDGLARVCNHANYRPVDYENLTARVAQLEAQLPMQAQLLEVPYENTLGGTEIFTSGSSHLVPTLDAWFGTAVAGQDSTLFLYGKHFSVHETRIIAGGADCTPSFVLLSRNVGMITIPKTAVVTKADPDHHDVIDVHIASPSGISNHLYVDVAKVQAPAGTAYVWAPNVLELAYIINGAQIQPPAVIGKVPPGGLIISMPSKPDLSNTTATITLTWAKPFDQVPPVTIPDVPYTKDQGFIITDPVFSKMIADIFNAFTLAKPAKLPVFTGAVRPSDLLATGTVTLKTADKVGAVLVQPPQSTVTDTLTIRWIENSCK